MKVLKTRRDFLQATALGTLSTSLLGAGRHTEALPHRKLGKTGVSVSMLGFGGGSRILTAPDDEALRIIERAFALGINYFDTAAAYGVDRRSERLYGQVLPAHRAKIFLATKTMERSHDAALRSVEESLRMLRTDKLDLIQIHDVGPSDDPTAWERPDGVLHALRRLQSEHVVRFVGFTGHQSAEVHRKVIESLEFDTVLMALNATPHRAFREQALPAAAKRGLGIIAMKTTRRLVGTDPGQAPPRDLLGYVWDLPISTAIVGMETIAVVEENVGLARAYRPGAGDRTALAARLTREVRTSQLDWLDPAHRDV